VRAERVCDPNVSPKWATSALIKSAAGFPSTEIRIVHSPLNEASLTTTRWASDYFVEPQSLVSGTVVVSSGAGIDLQLAIRVSAKREVTYFIHFPFSVPTIQLTLQPQCQRLQSLLHCTVKMFRQQFAALCGKTVTAFYSQYESLSSSATFNRENHRACTFDLPENPLELPLYRLRQIVCGFPHGLLRQRLFPSTTKRYRRPLRAWTKGCFKSLISDHEIFTPLASRITAASDEKSAAGALDRPFLGVCCHPLQASS